MLSLCRQGFSSWDSSWAAPAIALFPQRFVSILISASLKGLGCRDLSLGLATKCSSRGQIQSIKLLLQLRLRWFCFDLIQAQSGLSPKWSGLLIAQTKAGIINSNFTKWLLWNALKKENNLKPSKELSSSFRELLSLGSAISQPPLCSLHHWVSGAILFDLSLKTDLS